MPFSLDAGLILLGMTLGIAIALLILYYWFGLIDWLENHDQAFSLLVGIFTVIFSFSVALHLAAKYHDRERKNQSQTISSTSQVERISNHVEMGS
jgi:thiol:disulfide interchange protein